MEIKITSEDYLKNRLDEQIEWYGKKSVWNQKCFKRLRLVEIVAAAMIPFLTAYISDDGDWLKWVVGGLGLIIAVFSGIAGLYKFQENWLTYRSSAERLIQERYLFSTGAEPYDGDNPFKLLVKRVEATLAHENKQWQTEQQKQPENTSNVK